MRARSDAVALVRSGLVALGALKAARPAPGEAALITGAASGVGHLAVRLARLRGASRVVGAVSALTLGKAEFVRGFGADEVIAYDSEDWGEPVDYVLDAVGGDLLTPAVAALAPGGRLVVVQLGRRERAGVRPAGGRQVRDRLPDGPDRPERAGAVLSGGARNCGDCSRREPCGPPCTGSSPCRTRRRRTRRSSHGATWACCSTDAFRLGVNTTCARFLWGRREPK